MKRELNWKTVIMLKNLNPIKLTAILGILLTINFVYGQNDPPEKICKIRTSDSNGHKNPYIYIGSSNSAIGADYPCNARFSISVEDDTTYIFSAASAFNATLAPNDSIDYPDDGIGENGKRDNKMTYSKSFSRIKNLKVGYTSGTLGKKWSLDAAQLKQMYPDGTFDVTYKGETRTAFSADNLLYEMLISIKELNKNYELQNEVIEAQQKKIELLDLHNQILINQIEALQGAVKPQSENHNEKTFIGDISISPNPNNNGFLYIDYSVFTSPANLSILITNIQGKTVYEEGILPQVNGKHQIQLKLPAGVYLYHLTNQIERTIAKKLIIQ